MTIKVENSQAEPLTDEQIEGALKRSLEGRKLGKVLVIPPDFTRFHSNAGYITSRYYHLLKDKAEVDILPALGTHDPMTKEEIDSMFPGIPHDRFIVHNWREDIVNVGEVPASYVKTITDGLWEEGVTCEVNRLIMDESYDLILSIGQVVPHEVIGMANHAKNVFVGCGGKDTIHQSHMIGALYGMERMMGKDHTPVRKVLDYALKHFLRERPILFVLTVTTTSLNRIDTRGLYIGDTRETLEDAVHMSQQQNIDFLSQGIKKCVVYLDAKEFKSTWLGNKAIYRTRMAIEDGGELLILAPGITKFGEDHTIDRMIRKYGYVGRDRVMELIKDHVDLQENMAVAAHLIHSSADGRFKITYATRHITEQEVRNVGFNALSYDEAIKRYDPQRLTPGWNELEDGETIFYISNPALGLWIDRNRF